MIQKFDFARGSLYHREHLLSQREYMTQVMNFIKDNISIIGEIFGIVVFFWPG